MTEADIEELVLKWLDTFEINYFFGPTIAPGEFSAEREDYFTPILPLHLKQTLNSLNSKLPKEVIDDAYRKNHYT